MIRRFSILCLAVAVSACANQQPAPPPVINSAPSIPAAPPRGEPQDYVNLPAASLRVAFGAPAFVRKDGATEMWRYDGANCRAFFFLYGTPPMVRHVETLPHGVQSAADSACLTALRAGPAKAS